MFHNRRNREEDGGFFTIEDYISPKQYFWQYEKPFARILDTLEQHSKTLRSLNLRNFAFGTLENGQNKVTCWLEESNILKALSAINLPVLDVNGGAIMHHEMGGIEYKKAE